MNTLLRLLLAFTAFATTTSPLLAQSNTAPAAATAESPSLRLVFDGVKSEQKWALNDLSPGLPSDWTPFDYLVLELRASTPQRFSLWVHTTNGPRRIMLQPL